MSELESSKQSKRDILKSTALLGGSSFITVVINMVKTKIIAVLLGPAGMGFQGILFSLRDIVALVTGLGLQFSGVREIAYAVGKQDANAISVTVKTVRLLVWITGLLAVIIMLVGAKYLSILSFDSTEYSFDVALIGISIFFGSLSGGLTFIIQGYRRLLDLAIINIFSAINGVIISIPILYYWGIKGVVPSMIVGSATMLVFAWFYVKKIKIDDYPVKKIEYIQCSTRLMKLGIPLMASGIIYTLSDYVIRIFLTRKAGLEAVGHFQAAFKLASVMVNFVLNAMGTDYYPRLTAISDDKIRINKEVNEQTEVAMLIALPALVVTIIFMPQVVWLLYSKDFTASLPVLQWAIFGIFGRVTSWPLAMIMLAKAKGRLFLISELVFNTLYVCLIIVFYNLFGLAGTGIAFTLMYVLYNIFVIFISQKIADVSWNMSNIKLIVYSLMIVIVLSIIQKVECNNIIKYSISITGALFIIFYYLKRLSHVTGITVTGIYNKAKNLISMYTKN